MYMEQYMEQYGIIMVRIPIREFEHFCSKKMKILF